MLTIKDCGIMLEPQLGLTMDTIVQTAKLAEELGFGYLFRSDHLLPTAALRGKVDSPECWTSLGAIAASTSRIKFGPMVSPIGFRNPALLAKMACTVHSYSKGRLQLSVGAGWYEAEYLAHGYRFPLFRERVAQFSEALDILVAMVRDGNVDYDGKYFSAHTDCLPRPDGDVHLIIGAKSPSLVRIAAKRSDEWNIFVAQDDEYLKLRQAFEGASDGKRPEISETGPFLIGRDQSELESSAKLQAKKMAPELSPSEMIARIKARNSPVGTVEQFVEKMQEKIEGGVQKYYFQTLTPENTGMTELLADTLRRGV